MRKKGKRRQKVLYLILGVLFFILVSFIIQISLMPKWHDGNTQVEQTAENGLHEQDNKIERGETGINMTAYIRNEVTYSNDL